MLCLFRLKTVLVGLFLSVCAVGQSSSPIISEVANAASYANGPVSPGALVVLFGSGLGPSELVNLQLDEQGRVATSLSGVQVLFDGMAAPLIYVSQTQIAAMVPYSVNGKATTQIQVSYAGTTSAAVSRAVAATAPGIFTANASGRGQGAITNSNGSSNSIAIPAAPGSFVTIYLTGEGQTEPPSSDGTIATGAANVKAQVSVSIAGKPAQVLYAGSAPGNVNGFAQVNVVIPADLQYGGNLPLVVKLGDASSQSEITVAVTGPSAPLPGAPTLRATVNSTGQVTVQWTSADDLASRFRVERRVSSIGSFTEMGVLASTAASFTDTSVVPGTGYEYRIRADGDYGLSPYSATASVSVPATQIHPPSRFQAVAVRATQVNLTWDPPNTSVTSLQLERKTGSAGTYQVLSTLPSTARSYSDTNVAANSAYTYRIRSQGASGTSAYSSEVTATTPAVPLPSAPILQVTALSSTQVRLTWTSTATNVVRFRVERRLASTQYTEISQPGPSTTTFDDGALNASTVYFYRIRVETGAGLSSYSNEITATTSQGLPAAPTNLQATATSSTGVTLRWTNNAPDAAVIRIESRPAGVAAFSDIGTAASFTTGGVINLQANTSYTFRVRAQNAVSFSAYSNETTVTTLPVPKTVFLVHGLTQVPADLKNLAVNLSSSYGVDGNRFASIDYGFDFSDCAGLNLALCSANCTVSNGAQRLAQYIVNKNPPGDIVLIGFSMGGLLARDLISNNRIVLNGRKITLITIGTPNLGYPYFVTDSLFFCSALVSSMDGNWRSQPNTVVLSPYLLSLMNQWASKGFPGSGGTWLAASGRAYSDPKRASSGCRDQYPFSDGVVCADSAEYNVNTPTGTQPSERWQDPERAYVHSHSAFTSLILGDNTDSTRFLKLWDPPPYGSLFNRLTAVLNGL